MANTMNAFCLKGLLKLIIVLAIIAIVIVIGLSLAINSLTIENLNLENKKILQNKTLKEVGLQDATMIELYDFIKTFSKNISIENSFSMDNDKDIFEESGIIDKLPKNDDKIDFGYLINNKLELNEAKTINLRDTEVAYLLYKINENGNTAEEDNLKFNIKEVTIIVAGGKPSLSLTFDISEEINKINFNYKFLEPKNLYAKYYFDLTEVDGILSAKYKGSSINGLNNSFTEVIIKSINGNISIENYGNLYGEKFCKIINNLGKVKEITSGKIMVINE